MFDYMDNWRQYLKEAKKAETLSPKKYGELCAKKKTKRKGKGK